MSSSKTMNTYRSLYKKNKVFKPEWAKAFSHYNQMDRATFYLAEFIWEHRERLLETLPDSISMISQKSSYHSDRAYVEDQKVRNPAKFIYTLPSVRINVICGLLDWEGPVFCFLNKSEKLLGSGKISPWILEIDETDEEIRIELTVEGKNTSEGETVKEIVLNGADLKLGEFTDFINGAKVSIDRGLQNKIEASAGLLNSFLKADKTIYGVNTGYGYNCTNVINAENMSKLQSNLVTYLRCGTGRNLSYKESKAVGVARFISISKGFSGVSFEFIERFKSVLSLDYVPLVPSNGSLGASGDLIPLAYWAEFLQGEGRAMDASGEVRDTLSVFKEKGLSLYAFKPKEGLSVVNGTSAMAGLAYTNFVQTEKLIYFSGVLTSWGLMALKGWSEAFSPLVNQKVKDFRGQAKFANMVSQILSEEGYNSGRSFDVQKLGEQTDRPLQDRYSIRCAPQIMGPFIDTMNFGKVWIEKEINGVSDNPIFDAESEEVAMGGNFYGGYMSQLMDYLKISLVQMADMVDRQLLLVMDGYTNNGLPTNLVNPNLKGFEKNMNHGLKGLHQSASAITSEIAALCMPNSIFSRSSETHNQDKVSLGFSACKQYGQMIELAFELTALSMVCLAQALDIRKLTLKGQTAEVYKLVRKHIPFVEQDRALSEELSSLIKELKEMEKLGGANEIF